MKESGRGIDAYLWVILTFILIIAVAGFLVSFVPLEMIVNHLGSMSGSGDGAPKIAERFGAVVARTRLTSAIMLLGWASLLWQHRRLGCYLDLLVNQVSRDAALAPRRILAAIQTAFQHRFVETLTFLVVLAIGIALRIHYLDRDIRHDEAWTYIV